MKKLNKDVSEPVPGNKYAALWARINQEKNGERKSVLIRAGFKAREWECALEDAEEVVKLQDQADVYPSFFLTALGDAIAQQQAWVVQGMDAIVFALTDRYGWEPQAVRKMALRDQWLALPDPWKRAQLSDEAQSAWKDACGAALPEPGQAYWSPSAVPTLG